MKPPFRLNSCSVAIAVLLATSCSDDFARSGVKDARSSSTTVATTVDSSGNYIATLSPNATSAQVMKATGGDVAGSAIVMPPGSLSIPVNLTIGQGSNLTTDSLSSLFGLADNKPSAAGPSVSFVPSEAVNASSPFTLSIPLSASSSLSLSQLLLNSGGNLVVLYQVTKVVGGEKTYTAGVIPKDEVTITKKSVSFQSSFLGTFQLAYTPRKVEAKIEKPTEEAPALKSSLNITISRISPAIAKPGQTVYLTGTGFVAKNNKYEVSILDKNEDKVKATVLTISPTSASFVMPEGSGIGSRKIVFLANSARVSEHQLIADSLGNTLPFVIGDGSNICTSTTYIDENGTTQQGQRDCATIADCTVDGELDCKATSTFKAVNMSLATTANIASGVTVAGITGSMIASPSLCSGDGSVSCLTGASYKAVDMSQVIATNILNTAIIAGVNGSLANAPNCSMNGEQNCVASATYYASQACPSEGDSNCYIPTYDVVSQNLKAINYPQLTTQSSNFRAGTSFGGVSGQIADCSGDNGSGCVATNLFKSVTKTSVTSGIIRAGVTIAGITGGFPSASHKLTGDTGFTDLTTAGFNSLVTSGSDFDFWDSYGVRHTASGDADLTAIQLKIGTTIFGVNGTYTPATVDPWDLRAGVDFNGMAGKLRYNCRNAADLSVFDFAPTSTVDWWDTINDFALGSPTSQVPGSWSSSHICGGTQATAGDDNVWKDVTTTGDGTTLSSCGTYGIHCTFEDKITKLQWSKVNPTQLNWYEANLYCKNLSHNGLSDWRLPDQKELLQAHVDGIARTINSDWNTAAGIVVDNWSATSYSANPGSTAFKVNLSTGQASIQVKTAQSYANCVRP